MKPKKPIVFSQILFCCYLLKDLTRFHCHYLFLKKPFFWSSPLSFQKPKETMLWFIYLILLLSISQFNIKKKVIDGCSSAHFSFDPNRFSPFLLLKTLVVQSRAPQSSLWSYVFGHHGFEGNRRRGSAFYSSWITNFGDSYESCSQSQSSYKIQTQVSKNLRG